MGSMITLSNAKYTFSAYSTRPDTKGDHPGIILIHEVWGLNDHIKDVSDRVMKQGYSVLAPDLLSQTGILDKLDDQLLKDIADPAKRDEAQKRFRAFLTPLSTPDFARETVDKLQICFEHLRKQNPTKKIGVVGFCFGGTYSFALACAQPNLACAIPFYGHPPKTEEEIATINCPIYAFYGEKDTGLVDPLPDLVKTMEQYNKSFQYKVYPNCGHAFFNDTRSTMYNKEAATDSWSHALTFLSRHFS